MALGCAGLGSVWCVACGAVWRCVALGCAGLRWAALGAGLRCAALGGAGLRCCGAGWRFVALGCAGCWAGLMWRCVALGGSGLRWVALGCGGVRQALDCRVRARVRVRAYGNRSIMAHCEHRPPAAPRAAPYAAGPGTPREESSGGITCEESCGGVTCVCSRRWYPPLQQGRSNHVLNSTQSRSNQHAIT